MTSIMPVTGVPDAARSSSASQDAQTNQAMAQEQQMLNPMPSSTASPAAIIALSQAVSTQDERATTSPTPTAESPPQTGTTTNALSTSMSSEVESPNGYTSNGSPSFESQSNDHVNSQLNFLA